MISFKNWLFGKGGNSEAPISKTPKLVQHSAEYKKLLSDKRVEHASYGYKLQGDENSSRLSKKYTKKEKDSINHYTDFESLRINQHMRGEPIKRLGNPNIMKKSALEKDNKFTTEIKNHANNIKTALKKDSFKTPQNLYRGISGEHAHLLTDHIDHKHFLNASRKPQVAVEFATGQNSLDGYSKNGPDENGHFHVMKIRVKAGTNHISTQPFKLDTDSQEEHEHILPPGTLKKTKVTSMKYLRRKKPDIIHIHNDEYTQRNL